MQHSTRALLNSVCEQIKELVTEVNADTTDVVNAKDHVTLIRHYAELDDGIEKIKEARKALDAIDEKLSREYVPDALRLVGVKSTKIEGVGLVSISHRWSCSILDKALAFAWLRKNNHGGLIQETVASQTLAAFAKDESETSGRDLPEELFKVGRMAYTSLRRTK